MSEADDAKVVDITCEADQKVSALVAKVRGYIVAMAGDPHNDTQMYYKTAALEALDALERGDEQVEVGEAPVGEQGVGSEGVEPEAGSGDNVVGKVQGTDEPGVQGQ